jgi:hypothetical protein
MTLSFAQSYFYNVERLSLQRLYKIAHVEPSVDKWISNRLKNTRKAKISNGGGRGPNPGVWSLCKFRTSKMFDRVSLKMRPMSLSQADATLIDSVVIGQKRSRSRADGSIPGKMKYGRVAHGKASLTAAAPVQG